MSSSEMVINQEEVKRQPFPPWANNQVIRAKVLSQVPQGNAQLLIDGQKVMAKTSILLQPGEEVQLKVVALKDDVILKLIAPVLKITPQQISSLVSFFSKNNPLPDIFGIKSATLKSQLYDMALKSDKPDETFLPKLMDKSGLLWEKKVARMVLGTRSASDITAQMDRLFKQDIKGHILREQLMADPQKLDTSKSAAAVSETIENFQLLNHQSSDTGRFLLPFPIFSGSAFSFGQLLIDTGVKSRKDDKTGDTLIHVSFLLNMSRLGPLRADFSILKKEITGRFLFKDAVSCEYVRSMIPALKTRLSSVDYQVRRIECALAEEDIQPGCFIENLIKVRDDHLLNIVI